MWGQGGVCVKYLGARCVNHVVTLVKPYKTESCANVGELHKDMIGANFRGSSNEALAF
jgi:hypothetical protein